MHRIISLLRSREKTIIYLVPSLMIFFLFIWIRISYASPYASTWDMVDFSLAIERFDIFMMQPHFPGYPYFIMAGMGVHQWITDPTEALSFANAIILSSTVIPVFLILKNKAALAYAYLGSFAILSVTYLWVLSTQPMSEASAVAVLVWYLWSMYASLKNPRKLIYSILSSLIFSILMGIRLSYFPLGITLIFMWWKRWGLSKKKSFVFLEITLFILFNMIWIGALIASTGGISHFLSLSLSFIEGHFMNWGGSAISSEPSLIERLNQLFTMNFLWTGLLGESILSGICVVMMIGILIRKKTWQGLTDFDRWIVWLFLSYFLWAWIGQNIEKPRHSAPLIVLAIIMILRQGLFLSPGSRHALFFKLTLVLFMMIQSINGILLVKDIHSEVPASYQLETYLSGQEDRIAVYTWEEERVFDYLNATFYYKKVYSYHLFREEVTRLNHRRILVTDRAVRGFKNQGIDVDPHISEVKDFHSNKMVDPIYNEIKLYEWDPAVETP